MRDIRTSEMVDAICSMVPPYFARQFAHEHKMPWERVAALERLLEDMSSPGIEFLGDSDREPIDEDRRCAYRALELCGSPIEELFFSYVSPHYPDWKWVSESEVHFCDTGRVMLQHKVESYRLDFAIVGANGNVAVELDGHDWHERSKSQAAKDKSRDRRLQELGWKVLRFTGSEIWANPRKCVVEAYRIAGLYG